MMYSDTLYLLDKQFLEEQKKKGRKRMTSEVFNKHLRYMQEVTVDTLTAKAAEYASDGDRLHNFKVAAATQGITPAKALGGMMCKHTVSVYDMIGTGESYPLALWEEKIKDSINYLYLLWAMVNEDG